MTGELEQIWSRVLAQLALVVDEPTYRIWLEPLRAVALEDDRLLVQAPALGAAPACTPARSRVHAQTVSRLRPLSRRRFSVSRPARVAIRARNPWVRARLRFLGW